MSTTPGLTSAAEDSTGCQGFVSRYAFLLIERDVGLDDVQMKAVLL